MELSAPILIFKYYPLHIIFMFEQINKFVTSYSSKHNVKVSLFFFFEIKIEQENTKTPKKALLSRYQCLKNVVPHLY